MTFDPQFSFNQQDIDFLVENGLNLVRLYVAWQGVEFGKGRYNMTYLHVSWG
jgi:aryl-phospho-beta-D-glucosidase BglC (GH1 family)